MAIRYLLLLIALTAPSLSYAVEGVRVIAPLESNMSAIDDEVLNSGTMLPPRVAQIVDRVQSEVRAEIPVYVSGFTRYAQAGRKAIYVGPQLLALLTEEELIFVLLHEMAHVLNKDGDRLLARSANDQSLPLPTQYDNLARLSFSMEIAADRFAIKHGLAMGLSKEVMRNALLKIELDNQSLSQKVTHPELVTRLQQLDLFVE